MSKEVFVIQNTGGTNIMILRDEIELILRRNGVSNHDDVTDEIIKKIVKILKEELDNTNLISPLNMNFGRSEINRMNGTTYHGIERAITVIKKNHRKTKK